MISYLKCAVEYLNENKMDKSPQLHRLIKYVTLNDYSLVKIVFNCFILSMLYALIPNIPLINVNVRPIKPNKLVMLNERSKEKLII